MTARFQAARAFYPFSAAGQKQFTTFPAKAWAVGLGNPAEVLLVVERFCPPVRRGDFALCDRLASPVAPPVEP